ncbi:hypothetical protein Tco_0646669 [Tanacetum coccineum]
MNAPNPDNAMLDLLSFNMQDAAVIPNMISHFYIRQGPQQRQKEEYLRNWNWEEVIDVDLIPDEDMDVDMTPDVDMVPNVDMVPDEEGVDGLDLEELFGLGLDDDDIMPNHVGPNTNAQRQNTVQVLNRHRVYNIMYEND